MSRQQYGAHKAIAGVMAAQRRADEACAEGARRFDACKSVADVKATLDWMEAQNFFFATKEASQTMRAAFDRARERVKSTRECSTAE